MAKRTGLVARVPAGLTDAAMASLATFLTGLVAVNALDDATRGVYAVFFTAFLAGAVIPTQLAFIPAETEAVQQESGHRLGSIRATSRLGGLVGMAALLPVGLALAVSLGRADGPDIVALAVTAAVVSIVSPVQDHVRRMLHLAGFSWRAASMSGVQLAGVVIALGLLFLFDAPTAWIPFGGLALANVSSLSFGLFVATRRADSEPGSRISLADLVKAGRWLLVMALGPRLSFFTASVVITLLAGPEALGFAEAARIATQPLYVLSLGLEAVVRPHAMVAAAERDAAAARKHRKVFYPVMGGCAALFIAWCGFDWAGNPFSYLLPSAYEVGGLVIVTALATLARGAILPSIAEMLGARIERRLALVAITVTPVQVVAALTAGVTGAFARPVGTVLDYVGRFVVYERDRPEIYKGRTAPTPT
jgi:hypothetical protein